MSDIDIEDISADADERISHDVLVQPKRFHLRREPTADADPPVTSVWVKTWGCSHNSSDSEYMAGQLAASGYCITENKSDADVWILNSCTVKHPSESTFLNFVSAGSYACN